MNSPHDRFGKFTAPSQGAAPGAPHPEQLNLAASLLCQAGLIKREQYADCEIMSRQTGLNILKMLVMSGYIKENLNTLALEAAELVLREGITEIAAARCLHMAVERKQTIQDALSELAGTSQENQPILPPKPRSMTQLCSLLTESGAVDSQSMSNYLATQRETGLPLGRIITHAGVIDPEVVMAALTAQVYERDGYLTQVDILEILVLCYRRGIDFETALKQTGRTLPVQIAQIRTGEILVKAGLAQKSSIISALELALLKGSQIGVELINMGQIDENTLSRTLLLQDLVRQERLAMVHAPSVLKRSVLNREELSQSLAELAALVLDTSDIENLEALLKAVGVCSQANLEAIKTMLGEKTSFTEYLAALVHKQHLDDGLALCTARLLYLLRMEAIKPEEAIDVLKYCKDFGVDADSALNRRRG